jgi:DUF1680 family protein
VNGQEIVPEIVSGYAAIPRSWNPGDELTVRFSMPVQAHYANYEVVENRGRVAISRGPLVYCAEEIDNAGKLDRFAINPDQQVTVTSEENELGKIVSLSVPGSVEQPDEAALYALSAPEKIPSEIKMIPYYAWDNRTPGEMLVWLRRES